MIQGKLAIQTFTFRTEYFRPKLLQLYNRFGSFVVNFFSSTARNARLFWDGIHAGNLHIECFFFSIFGMTKQLKHQTCKRTRSASVCTHNLCKSLFKHSFLRKARTNVQSKRKNQHTCKNNFQIQRFFTEVTHIKRSD